MPERFGFGQAEGKAESFADEKLEIFAAEGKAVGGTGLAGFRRVCVFLERDDRSADEARGFCGVGRVGRELPADFLEKAFRPVTRLSGELDPKRYRAAQARGTLGEEAGK